MKPAFFFAVPLTGRKGWRTPGQTPAGWKRFTIEWEWRRFLGDAISELEVPEFVDFRVGEVPYRVVRRHLIFEELGETVVLVGKTGR